MDVRDLTGPFLVCDLDRSGAKLTAIRAAFSADFPKLIVGYSYKTNYLPHLLRHLHSLGAFAEVVSMIEYELAARLGLGPDHIIFNGPAKRREDVERALADGCLLNVDSEQEVEHVVRWARDAPSRTARVGLRVAPLLPEDGEAHESRMGLSLIGGELRRAVDELGKVGNVAVDGLHVHLSSKSRALGVFEGLAATLTEAAEILPSTDLSWVDVGGGFGFAPSAIPHLRFPDFASYSRTLAASLRRFDFTQTTLIVEPGISLVGDCFSFYAPIVAIKRRRGRRLLVVDGSAQIVRPSGHSHALPITALDRQKEALIGPPEPCDVSGYTCMEDDYLARGAVLPEVAVGDYVRFDNVGAYTVVFKPPFIRGAPPIYARLADRLTLARRAESTDDLFSTYEL